VASDRPKIIASLDDNTVAVVGDAIIAETISTAAKRIRERKKFILILISLGGKMKSLKLKEKWQSLGEELNFSCLICKTKAYIKENNEDKSREIICPRCGWLKITYHLWEASTSKNELGFKSFSDQELLLLSSDLRRRQENTNKKDLNTIKLDTQSLKIIGQNAINNEPNFSHRLFILLEAIEKLQSFLGEEVVIEDEWIENYLLAMAYLKDDKELEYCLNSLRELGYIRYPNTWTSKYKHYPPFRITSQGYGFLEKFRNKKDSLKSEDVFVAIELKEEFDHIYSAIKQAIEKAGYNPRRADKEHYTDYIMDWIKAKIKESRFLVAEITTGNLGVYFEIGYALGLGIPVIPILKKEKDEENPFEKVHFDLKQFNIIVYEAPEDLEEKLCNRIAALFGILKKQKEIMD